MARTPFWASAFRANLEQDEIILPPEMPRHLTEGFPIEAFIVDTQAGPVGSFWKHLEQQRRDAGSRLAAPGIARNQPAPAKICPSP